MATEAEISAVVEQIFQSLLSDFEAESPLLPRQLDEEEEPDTGEVFIIASSFDAPVFLAVDVIHDSQPTEQTDADLVEALCSEAFAKIVFLHEAPAASHAEDQRRKYCRQALPACTYASPKLTQRPTQS